MTSKRGDHEPPTQRSSCFPPSAAQQPTGPAPTDPEPEEEKKAWEKIQSRLGKALDWKKIRTWDIRQTDGGDGKRRSKILP